MHFIPASLLAQHFCNVLFLLVNVFLHTDTLNKHRYWNPPSMPCDFREKWKNKVTLLTSPCLLPALCLTGWVCWLQCWEPLYSAASPLRTASNHRGRHENSTCSDIPLIYNFFFCSTRDRIFFQNLLIIPVKIFSSNPAQNKVLYLNWAYQADVAEVKQTERSGGNRFSLDEVLQHIRGCRLDITIVLTQHTYTNLMKHTCMTEHFIWLTPLKHHSQSHKSITLPWLEVLFVGSLHSDSPPSHPAAHRWGQSSSAPISPTNCHNNP